MDKDAFLKLDTPAVRDLLKKKRTPRTGIFLSDGNRRLVMTETGKQPGDNGFLRAYLEIVTGYFRKNLDVFFDHGLENLFFPIFGDSLLERGKAYVETVIPELIRILFQEKSWLDFYVSKNIRIKTYGNMQKLDAVFSGRNLKGKINGAAAATSGCCGHTLNFGFFSTPNAIIEMREPLNGFVSEHGREPGERELIELYYGEPVPKAEFFINSIRTGGLGALPPLITGKETKIYTLPAPGIYSLSARTFREILYDILFCPYWDGNGKSGTICRNDIDQLNRYFSGQRDRVLGTGRKINRFRVLDADCGCKELK